MPPQSTILIVDDTTTGRKSLEILLAPEGYKLAFASNGTEALAQAKKLIPDLILLDIIMPDMDGYEVCRRLRAHPLLAEVPIIMITALDDRESRLEGIEAGADDFIHKPFDKDELRARVRSVARLNRYRRLLVERVRFKWVVEHAEDGYLIVDEDDKILYANSSARHYLGLPEESDEPIGEPFLALARARYRCEPQEAWVNWPRPPSGQPQRYLVCPESETAHAFWLRVDLLSLPSGPDMAGTVRLRDVTTQMNTLRDMRGFNAIITHKLRTPLIGMISSLELMAKHAPKLSSDEVSELSQTALKSVQRLRGEIDDILQYLHAPTIAEPGTGASLLSLQPLVGEISAELKLESVKVIGLEELAGTRLSLSQRAIELVLWEILENAKKFHPEQSPKVEIRVSHLDDKQVSLQIGDDGLTLSPEQLANMWMPYYQGEKSFTGEMAGMGLGLAMVAAVVWEAGGKCHARNQKDRPGIVVELMLPCE